jgi:hypothetical protein
MSSTLTSLSIKAEAKKPSSYPHRTPPQSQYPYIQQFLFILCYTTYRSDLYHALHCYSHDRSCACFWCYCQWFVELSLYFGFKQHPHKSILQPLSVRPVVPEPSLPRLRRLSALSRTIRLKFLVAPIWGPGSIAMATVLAIQAILRNLVSFFILFLIPDDLF